MKSLALAVTLCTVSLSCFANSYECPASGRKSHDGAHNGGHASFVVECKSTPDSCFNRCYLGDVLSDAYVIKQTSTAKCIEGVTWGREVSSVWVDRGCEAIFEVYTY